MSVAEEQLTLRPQKGPQYDFLASRADVVIFGGAAGGIGGKTFGLLLDPVRYLSKPGFGGVIFRATSVQVRSTGGLWDESREIYPILNGEPHQSFLSWTFPTGSKISFSYLERDVDVFNYQGAQFAWIGWDELTHFSEYQFFYMLTRNRSATAGIKPRVRAGCNPDPDSWVRKFIDWWIGDDGFPIQERCGKLRWFVRINDEIVWRDTAEEIYLQFGRGPEIKPKSVTFIPSKLQDNKILMEKDPNYLGNLLAQDRVTRGRLLEGNWNIRANAGTIFRREWFKVLDAIPDGWIRVIRFWDRAATKPHEGNKDPDWTRGLKLYKYPNGSWVVGDLKSTRDTPGRVEDLIKNVASHDTNEVEIASQTDPGSAGKKEAEVFTRMLAGYNVRTSPNSKDKITRAKPVSAQCEAGNVYVLRAGWNDEFFKELENFPEGGHDDIVDTFSGAFNELVGGLSLMDV